MHFINRTRSVNGDKVIKCTLKTKQKRRGKAVNTGTNVMLMFPAGQYSPADP